MGVTLKKNFVPDGSTPFSQGWRKSIDSAGTIIREASHDSAQGRLTLAANAGEGPTSESPWYFEIHRILYSCEGETNAQGRYILRALSEIETREGTYTHSFNSTIGSGVHSAMANISLPTRPYRRLVEVNAYAYGNVTGNVDLAVKIGSDGYKLARFDSGDAQSVAIGDQSVVAADAPCNVTVGVRGGSPSGGRIGLSADSRLNAFYVKAFPMSMV